MAINHTPDNDSQEKQVVVVMIPYPAQGHLNQLLHLSRLISSYDIPVHYVGTTSHSRQAKLRVQGWNPLANSNIFFHEFPVPEFHNPAPNPNANLKFPSHILSSYYATLKLREPIYELLMDLSTTAKRVVVIHDSLMIYHVQDVPNVPNAETYCFQSISAFTLSSFFWDYAGKPSIPKTEIFEHLPSVETLINSDVNEIVKLNEECKKVNSGNLYNTCREIEGSYLDLLAQFLQSETDKNWAMGPFNPLVINDNDETCLNKRHKCLEWLDEQPANSVIFVSFGTTTSFSDEEVNEIAVGLEKSGQKFIWVLREADKCDIFTGEFKNTQLPKGYEERIKERGIIVRDWAPQLDILGHPSTGGFMSHCGWNSSIESISLGVPIAAWPMHSDQPRNAILITEVLKIGILVRDWENRDEVVKADTIENVVRRLMDSNEGEEIRKASVKLSNDIKNTVTKGGQSHVEMESFIAHIRR